jgi:phosphoribosyl 1,2-cyclic phosphodiesterase
MEFCVLGSGSRGNAVFIEKSSTAILIDCGFSGKETNRRLERIGRSIEDLDAIFVTHEHNDHIGGVGVLSRKCKIPVFINQLTLKGGEKKLGKLFKVNEFTTGDKIQFQDLEVKSFRISHDTNDPVGYVVNDSSKRFGYCTDTGKVSLLMAQRLKGCHGLVLEFNHDLDMLQNGPYPLPLQQRVRSIVGHLSNDDAAAFLKDLQHDELAHVFLAHLSEKNNHPKLAWEAAVSVMTPESPTQLHLAKQDSPDILVSL